MGLSVGKFLSVHAVVSKTTIFGNSLIVLAENIITNVMESIARKPYTNKKKNARSVISINNAISVANGTKLKCIRLLEYANVFTDTAIGIMSQVQTTHRGTSCSTSMTGSIRVPALISSWVYLLIIATIIIITWCQTCVDLPSSVASVPVQHPPAEAPLLNR